MKYNLRLLHNARCQLSGWNYELYQQSLGSIMLSSLLCSSTNLIEVNMLLWRGVIKYVSSVENNKYCALSAYNASLSVLESTDCQIPNLSFGTPPASCTCGCFYSSCMKGLTAFISAKLCDTRGHGKLRLSQ